MIWSRSNRNLCSQCFFLVLSCIFVHIFAVNVEIHLEDFELYGSAIIDGDSLVLNGHDDSHATGIAVLKENVFKKLVSQEDYVINFKLLVEKEAGCSDSTEGFALGYGAHFNCVQNSMAPGSVEDPSCATGVYLVIITNQADVEINEGVYLYSGPNLEVFWPKPSSYFMDVNDIHLKAHSEDGEMVAEVTVGKKYLGKATYNPSEGTQNIWFTGSTELGCGGTHEIFDLKVSSTDSKSDDSAPNESDSEMKGKRGKGGKKEQNSVILFH